MVKNIAKKIAEKINVKPTSSTCQKNTPCNTQRRNNADCCVSHKGTSLFNEFEDARELIMTMGIATYIGYTLKNKPTAPTPPKVTWAGPAVANRRKPS